MESIHYRSTPDVIIRRTATIILVLLLTTSSGVRGSPLRSRHVKVSSHNNPRWIQPCGGKETAGTSVTVWHALLGVPSEDVRRQFHAIYRKASDISKQIADLKYLYIYNRFEFPGIVEDLKQLEVKGMPKVSPNNKETLDNIQEVTVEQESYEYLARIAIFLEQARFDENAHEDGLYANYMEIIEEEGVYWILCELKKLLLQNGANVEPSTRDSLDSIEMPLISNKAMRHTRDFIILRDAEKTFQNMAMKFLTLYERRESTALLS